MTNRIPMLLALYTGCLAGCSKDDEVHSSKKHKQPIQAVPAESMPRKGIRIGPDPAEQRRQRLDRIAAKRLDGRSSLAIEELQEFLSEFPQDDLAWAILGHCYEDVSNPDEAERSYKSAIAINARQSAAWTGLGILQRKKKDYSSAIASYEKAIESNPDDADAHTSLAVVLMVVGNDEVALVHAKKAHLLSDDDPRVIANLAIAYHINGEVSWRDLYLNVLELRREHHRVSKLRSIFSGELTVRDEEYSQ